MSNTDAGGSYKRVEDFLQINVPSWFGMKRYVGGGGSTVIHIASGGLPQSRHPDAEAARLQTISAPRRLQKYQELIELIGTGLRVPIYLFEFSESDLGEVLRNARVLEDASRSKDLRSWVMPSDVREATEHQMAWNPALRVHLDGGPEVKSLWPETLARLNRLVSPQKKYVEERLKILFNALQKERRRKEHSVVVLCTENKVNLLQPIQEWNGPFLMARQTEMVVEYIKIKEPW